MNKQLKLWELDRVSEEEFKDQKKFPIIIVLDNIRSFSNIGSVFRTSDAFNVEKIYLCGITAAPPHREIQKTAIGATNSVKWEHTDSTLAIVQKLKLDGYTICSLEQTKETLMLNEVGHLKESKFVLVFGNEVDGVDQGVVDFSDYVIEVPQFGTKHSLNVSVCCGVVLWEFAKKWIVKH